MTATSLSSSMGTPSFPDDASLRHPTEFYRASRQTSGYGKLPTMFRSTLRAWFEAAPPLSQRRIFLFWLPLAASWLLMAGEQPFVNAALARLHDAERMIAAFGIVGSLSI